MIGPLPVIPLRDMVVIPNSMTTVFMGRPLSVLAEAAMRIHSGRVILLTQRDKGVDTPTPEDFWDVAVSGEIDQLLRLPDGSVKALVHGTERCRVTKWINASGFFKAEAEILQPEISPSDDLAAYSRTLLKSLQEYASNVKKFSPDHLKAVLEEKDPIRACDIAASFIPLTPPERLEYLRAASPVARFELLIGVLDRELESGQIEKRIQLRVKGQMEKNQREYYLNEQMKAIKKELGIEGEGEDGEDEDVALERKVRGSCGKRRAFGIEAPEEHAAVVGRSFGRAQLRRHASRYSLEEEEPRLARHRPCPPRPRRGSLGTREGEGTHSRIPRRAEARREG